MEFRIDNMACGGCAESVTTAIHSVDPQAKVDIDLNLRRVTIETVVRQSAVAAVLKDIGYPPSPTA